MKIDYLDYVSELQYMELQTKAVFNAFFREFIEPEKEDALKEIDYNHEDFIFVASTVLELIRNLIEKTKELEDMMKEETEVSE